jgi:hypothetical protein
MEKKNEIDAQAALRNAVPAGHYRYINDDEHAAAVAALAKIIGKRPAALPSWQRRLAITADGKTFLLVIDGCHWREPSSIVPFDDSDTYATTALPVALPLELGIQLLQSEANPELELARRRAKAKAREDARIERNRKEIEASRAEGERIQKAAQERIDCKADAFAKLSPLAQFAARLALMVEKRDKDLASDIRVSIDAPVNGESFPRGSWWVGLDRTLEDQRVAQVFELIPAEMRFALKMQHGPSPAVIVRAYETLRAANGKSKAA